MAAEQNLIKKADMAKIREVDFAYRFAENIKGLVKALGITRPIAKQAGTVLKAYKTTGTLVDGNVAEGDLIPLSHYKTEPVTFGEITLKKYRKAASAESIITGGFDQAVTKTDNRAVKDVQKTVKSDFYNFLASGTGAATGATFQAACAQVRGQLEILFEDQEVEPVYFVNPLDIADYLGTANITTQTAFGMTYFEDFLAPALEKAEREGCELYCGEYGVIDVVPPEDALFWFKTIHEVFEKHGIARCLWSYKEMDFGLADARMDSVRSELLNYV